MGIVNVTPDSFSDGGRYLEPEAALAHARRLAAGGADMLDIGGESTRPGYHPVPWEEEWRRLEPVLRGIVHERLCDVVSVDTQKWQVAARALEVGVDMINDISGGVEPEMLALVAEAGCSYVWMHNRPHAQEGCPFDTMYEETKAGIARCLDAGIRPEKLWIDPGVGFGKTQTQNLEILARLTEYCELGYPVLLGVSRKRVIRHAVGEQPEQIQLASVAAAAVGVWQGVAAVRVHDVWETAQVCRMVDAIRCERRTRDD
ncbi:MAG: dihydropteroate synthase [Alicyclobacillus sp.]|nr:dihydropteroate synthase [Alicyclobacillus sp.]